METKTSTKILMVALVLILATATMLAGYYYGRSSVVCQHDSYRCTDNQSSSGDKDVTIDKEGTADKGSDTGSDEVASESIRDVDFDQIFEDEINGDLDSYEYIGDVTYADITADGEEDAIFLAMTDGSGVGMGVFVYSYQNGVLKQLLEENGYSNYQFEITNQNRLRITAINMGSKQNKGKPHATMARDINKIYGWSNGKLIEQ